MFLPQLCLVFSGELALKGFLIRVTSQQKHLGMEQAGELKTSPKCQSKEDHIPAMKNYNFFPGRKVLPFFLLVSPTKSGTIFF